MSHSPPNSMLKCICCKGSLLWLFDADRLPIGCAFPAACACLHQNHQTEETLQASLQVHSLVSGRCASIGQSGRALGKVCTGDDSLYKLQAQMCCTHHLLVAGMCCNVDKCVFVDMHIQSCIQLPCKGFWTTTSCAVHTEQVSSSISLPPT